jgi:hypothetical protein
MSEVNMDIIVGNTVQLKKDPDTRITANNDFGPYPLKDRRRNKADRRKSSREGVFVSLSTQRDRRGIQDRRRI